jgi:hypothetical protein
MLKLGSRTFGIRKQASKFAVVFHPALMSADFEWSSMLHDNLEWWIFFADISVPSGISTEDAFYVVRRTPARVAVELTRVAGLLGRTSFWVESVTKCDNLDFAAQVQTESALG